MLTISGKALGRKKPLFADFSVPCPATAAGGLKLRDLITSIVQSEVDAFKQRQADRRLLKALTAKDVAEGVARGKIDMGGSDLDQHVDPDEAVRVALEAFTDGIYLVVVDGAEVKDLETVLPLQDDSRVAFVRLTMLAGG
jgi:hypothetical protein